MDRGRIFHTNRRRLNPSGLPIPQVIQQMPDPNAHRQPTPARSIPPAHNFPSVFVAAGCGRDLSSPTDRKPEQRAADDQHDDHDQDEFTDPGEEASGLQLGGE